MPCICCLEPDTYIVDQQEQSVRRRQRKGVFDLTATIVWSSSNYDYMKVDDIRYDAVIENDQSVFTIPVTCFDWKMAVVADTIAMSQPHEIDYALRFDSASITPVAS